MKRYIYFSPLRLAFAFLLCLASFSQAWAWGETTSYVLDDAKERSWSTISNTGNYPINGPAKTLTFQAKRTRLLGFSDGGVYAVYSTDGGSTWVDALTCDLPSTSTWYDFTCELPANANVVRIESRFGATGYKQVRNVKVTRATQLTTTTQSVEFAKQDVGATATKTASVSFHNTTYDQQITGTSTDSRFTVTPVTVGERGTTTVNITYSSATPGTHNAMVTLNMNGATVDIPVSGTSLPLFHFAASAQKIYDYGEVSATVTPTLRGEATTTQMQTQATFTAVPQADATFEGWYTDATHAELVSTDLTYTPTLTNSQYGSTQSLTLYAWFKKNQSLRWDNEDISLNLVNGGSISSSATATSGLTPEYLSSQPTILDVDAQGLVTALADYDEPILVTVSQPGNDEFNAATPLTRTFRILVLSKEITLSGTNATVELPDVVYDKVTLERTLKAGFSTIALPFETTVGDIVGEGYDAAQDWVAVLNLVTYNAQDGYSLYFKKVDDARLEANQPYVLHLATAIENPVFTDVLVVTPRSAERVVGLWKMVSNFTPALDMGGRYGVVNASGELKRGASGSYLNALAAYFVSPDGSAARSFFMDETTAIHQTTLEQTGTERYNLMGQRVGQQARGIVLQRGADGSMKKVIVR